MMSQKMSAPSPQDREVKVMFTDHSTRDYIMTASNIKEAEVFTELKEMGASNISKYIDKAVGNKKVWVLDVKEIGEGLLEAKDFKAEEETKAWE